MDRASEGLRADRPVSLPPDFNPVTGPLDRPTAIAMVQQADELLGSNEPDQALALYGRAASAPDRDVAAAGLLGMGNALYRLDRDEEALSAWTRVTEMPDAPATYRAWRQVAAARVRAHDLPAALEAYRQCERRAPAEDRAEIHSRLGWLSKETGNTRAAGRYFARSRGDALPSFMTYLVIAVTVVTSLLAMQNPHPVPGQPNLGGPLELQLELDKIAIAHGEIYRLFTVMLVHDPTNLLHLLFNMYALWFVGQLVERMYGSVLFLLFYVLCGVSASTASYVFGDVPLAVGASGAIFGLFGVALVATRYHHAVLDAQSRAIASQILFLIVINLALGFSGFFNVDNFAHVGGLVSGLWLALLIPPGRVPTLASLWQGQRGGAVRQSGLVRLGVPALAVAALIAANVVGYIQGTDKWQNAYYGYEHTTVVAAKPPAGVDLRLE